MSAYRFRAVISLHITARNPQDAQMCARELLERRVEGQGWGQNQLFQGEVINSVLLDDWTDVTHVSSAAKPK